MPTPAAALLTAVVIAVERSEEIIGDGPDGRTELGELELNWKRSGGQVLSIRFEWLDVVRNIKDRKECG